MAARSAWARLRGALGRRQAPAEVVPTREPRVRFEIVDEGAEGILLRDHVEGVEYPFWKYTSAQRAIVLLSADAAPFLHSFPIYTSPRGLRA